jgi:ATP-dependent phosphofructokinase / diphosphate-dependent phosphofructokinase
MRVAVSTGGGDAPGLNAVIRAATLCAVRRGWEVIGIRDGFNGLMFPEHYLEGGGTVILDRQSVRGIAHQGGTMLGSTNRGNPCHFPVSQPDGSTLYEDRTERLVELVRQAGIDALITIGGDGSLAIGQRLSTAGLRVVGQRPSTTTLTRPRSHSDSIPPLKSPPSQLIASSRLPPRTAEYLLSR